MKCKGSWLSKQILLFPGLCHILLYMAKEAVTLSHIPLTSSELQKKALHLRKGQLGLTGILGVGGYFYNCTLEVVAIFKF